MGDLTVGGDCRLGVRMPDLIPLSLNIDCIGACTLSRLELKSLGNMLAIDGLGDETWGSGDVIDLTELVSMGLRSGDEPAM